MNTIDELQQDALKEVGNVGASYACGALSKLIGKDILIDVTECQVNPKQGFLGRFGRPGQVVAIIKIDVMTEQGSRIFVIFPEKVATWLSDLMLGNEWDEERRIGKQDKEALVEMGDFCIREYLNPISKFLDTLLMLSPPIVGADILEKDLDSFKYAKIKLTSKNNLRVVTNFVDEKDNFQGSVVFLPDNELQDLVFCRFGVDKESQAETFSKLGV